MLMAVPRATPWLWRAALTGAMVATSLVLAAGQAKRPAGAANERAPSPDYDRVFAMDRVHEVRIVIAPERFREMQANLAGLGGRGGFPAFGRLGMPGPPPDALAEAAWLQDAVMACSGKAPESSCSIGAAEGRCVTGPADSLMCLAAPQPGRGRPPGGLPFLKAPEPMTVPVSVQFLGRIWTNVRMRYKGNSSLMAATSSQNGKIPFRLDFNHSDQAGSIGSFHGFRKLTFSSNFADDSQMREVLATEVLRDRGVPAARAAFYRVFVDTGDGAAYWGLYTMVEDPADGAMLGTQLDGRGANLYKPDGPAANWTRFDAASFEKKTNEGKNDFSDVIAAIDALHAQATDRGEWRSQLERVFDVDLFLRWLAVNTAIDNWDAYGAMAHNYYLYGDPRRNGRLRWIPWDHNMAFGAGPGGGRGFPGGPGRGQVPLFARGRGRGGAGPFGPPTRDVLHRDADGSWPLITRLLSDPEYSLRYRRFLSDSLAGLMAPPAMDRRVRELHALIAPAVVGSNGELKTHTTISSDAAFRESPDVLLRDIARQQERIRSALAESPQ
jgi:hypothetical protein